MFVDMCSLLCYIIQDTSKQVRKTNVTLTCVLRWYVCVVSEASRSQQQPVSLRYVQRAQPPVVQEDGSDFISSSHIALQQRTAQVVVQFIQSSILVLSALHWLFHPSTKVRFSTCFNKFIHDENFVVLFIGSDFISSSQQKLHRDTLIRFIHWYRFHLVTLSLPWDCIALVFQRNLVRGGTYCRLYRRYVQ